jgi:threonine dehydrogenase-like Zn-dependent dehydrogenase
VTAFVWQCCCVAVLRANVCVAVLWASICASDVTPLRLAPSFEALSVRATLLELASTANKVNVP